MSTIIPSVLTAPKDATAAQATHTALPATANTITIMFSITASAATASVSTAQAQAKKTAHHASLPLLSTEAPAPFLNAQLAPTSSPRPVALLAVANSQELPSATTPNH